MQRPAFWRTLLKRLLRRHGNVKSFEHDVPAQGTITGIADIGTRTVPAEKIVGSVSRWRNLRSDFFYRHGQAMTERFLRIGKAMEQGKTLPPLELYKVKGEAGDERPAVSEYYVVDGHHRVAMAKKLGQDFLDAHIVEYRLGPDTTAQPEAGDQTTTSAESSPTALPDPATSQTSDHGDR